MTVTNNVTRLLDVRKLTYTVYELPIEKHGAVETARLLDVEPASVFKTIVITRDKPKKPLLVVVPGPSTVDLKLLASALGEKKVYLPTEHEAEQLTGLQAGGISPLALINKGLGLGGIAAGDGRDRRVAGLPHALPILSGNVGRAENSPATNSFWHGVSSVKLETPPTYVGGSPIC